MLGTDLECEFQVNIQKCEIAETVNGGEKGEWHQQVKDVKW